MPEDASARNKGPLEAEPVRWRRLSDGQLFKSAGWQLELLKASPELDETATTTSSSTGSAGGALAKMDDAEELPWQVVALMSAQSLGEYVDRWRDHDKEVRLTDGSHVWLWFLGSLVDFDRSCDALKSVIFSIHVYFVSQSMKSPTFDTSGKSSSRARSLTR